MKMQFLLFLTFSCTLALPFNFPTEEEPERRLDSVPTCEDSQGRTQRLGQPWKEDCNVCRCLPGARVACTRRICFQDEGEDTDDQGTDDVSEETVTEESVAETTEDTNTVTENTDITGSDIFGEIIATDNDESNSGAEPDLTETESDPLPDETDITSLDIFGDLVATGNNSETGPIAPRTEAVHSLFRVVGSPEEASSIPQCQQGGVLVCRRVTPDLALLSALTVGQPMALLASSEETMIMELSREPTVTGSGGMSRTFKVGLGGQAVITVGPTGSMFGSINPASSTKLYAIESCGQDCTVLLERDSNWFNQFED